MFDPWAEHRFHSSFLVHPESEPQLVRIAFSTSWRWSMAIETIGRYQLHLFARELSGLGRWEAFLKIDKFDDEAQDFRCLLENHRVSDESFANYDEAIEAGRYAGNRLIKEGKV
jgi:hypothetical protein